jgi:MSHA biogenesis protein MshO
MPVMMDRHPSAGFTLIEMIMVIVITGIIAGMVAMFIRTPIQGYVDSVRRAELTDQADVALRRIARDVRLALPNSLREVTPNQSFEFIMTKSGGRYRDPADGSTGGDFLSYTSTADTSFDALGPLPAMNGGDRIVIYNLGTGFSPADAYAGGNVATISGTAAITANPVQLISNPFAAQSPPLPSPSARFQVVDQNDLVVRYVCDGQTLTRLSGCTLATPSACAGAGALLAGSATTEPKATCVIDYQANATGRNGLLYVGLTLTDTPSGEAVTLFQQIHVDNSP